MKLLPLLLGLCLSTLAIADVVTIDKNAETAVMNGTKKGSTSEVLKIITTAFEVGYQNSRGADIFTKTVVKEGKHSVISMSSKNIFVSRDANLSVMYEAIFKGKAGDISVDEENQLIVLKGYIAQTLIGAMRLVIDPRSKPQEAGLEVYQTVSGRVRCEKILTPDSRPTCYMAL